MIEKFLSLIKKKDKGWQTVTYPPSPVIKLFYIPLRLALVISLIFLEIIIIANIADKIHSNIGQIILTIILVYVIYKTISYYRLYRKKLKGASNKFIEKRLVYLIHSNKLYDEEKVGIEKEPRIVRTIQIVYREDDKRIYVRVLKFGDRFDKIAPTLGEQLESTLGVELNNTNSAIDYVEYLFLKERDERIDLSSSINNQQKNSDVIQITGNISYKLSKTPHSLIVGGTGSGKSFFILAKIVNYLSLTPQAELYIIDPKKADLSLLRFIEGMEDRKTE